MGVYHKYFPEFRLDLGIYFGRVTADEVIRTFNKLDPASNWLCYFDASIDVSGIDVAEFPAMKQAVTAKETAPGDGARKRCAFVNLSGPDELYVQFWSHYASAGIDHPHERRLFPDLEAACRWLALPPAAQDVFDATIIEALARPAEAPGLRRDSMSGLAPD